MREVLFTAKFTRDLKKVRRSVGRDVLLELNAVIESLGDDIPLAGRYRDHALAGEWRDFRECHVRPDLLLVYRKEPGIIRVVRLGGHSELFG